MIIYHNNKIANFDNRIECFENNSTLNLQILSMCYNFSKIKRFMLNFKNNFELIQVFCT